MTDTKKSIRHARDMTAFSAGSIVCCAIYAGINSDVRGFLAAIGCLAFLLIARRLIPNA